MSRNAGRFILIYMACVVVFITCLATCTSCSVLHKSKSKTENHSDSATIQSSLRNSQKRFDGTTTKTKENDYNKLIVELPEGGTISLADKIYKFPANSKATFESGSNKETSNSKQKTIEDNSALKQKSSDVKKDNKEANTNVSRNSFLPGWQYILAVIVVLAATIYLRKKISIKTFF